ncbi:hypothetical protein BDB01DRAFT_803418 [Pilobolus umbonatus]|nr:hypothetical protein BDB01DRAFT_803418 [Pilobolus umbonatus]
MLLPNMEELSINPSLELIQALIDTRKPILTKIKIFDFSFHTDGTQLKYADCCYRFRSSLTTLSTNYLDLPDHRLVPYLASFPCLNKFCYFSKDDTSVFNDLLVGCPMLTKLKFSCQSKGINRYNTSKIHDHPPTHLKLNTKHMELKVMQFIIDNFLQLKYLRLRIDSDLREISNIVNTVLQIRSLETIDIEMTGKFRSDIVKNFVEHSNHRAEKMKTSVNQEVMFEQSYSPRQPYFKIEYRRESPIGIRNRFIIDPHDSSVFREDWDLEDIHQQCPMLSELDTVFLKPFLRCGHLTVNKHLTSLILRSEKVNSLLLTQISVSCPMLKQLYFIGVDLTDGDNDNEIHCVELPITSLECRQFGFKDCEWPVLVVKPLNGVCIKSWRYCSHIDEMIVSEDPLTISDLRLWMDGPLYVFLCTSIEHVSIQ